MKNDEELDLTIVIVNWNLDKKLIRCIDSVIETIENLNYEVFIFDNNSPDIDFDSIINEYSEHKQLKFIKNKENKGGLAINDIKDQIKGRYLLMLGPDTVLKEDTVSNLIKFMDLKRDAGAASAKLLNLDGTPQLYYYRLWDLPMVFYVSTIIGQKIDELVFSNKKVKYYYGQDLDTSTTIEICQPAGACLITRTELLKEDNHIIDPMFPFYYNDADLCKRIWDKGYKIYLVSNAEVIHDHGSSFNKAEPSWKRIEVVKSQIKYFRKHYPGKLLFLKIILSLDSISRIMAYIFLKILRKEPKKFKNLPLKEQILTETKILRGAANLGQ